MSRETLQCRWANSSPLRQVLVIRHMGTTGSGKRRRYPPAIGTAGIRKPRCSGRAAVRRLIEWRSLVVGNGHSALLNRISDLLKIGRYQDKLPSSRSRGRSATRPYRPYGRPGADRASPQYTVSLEAQSRCGNSRIWPSLRLQLWHGRPRIHFPIVRAGAKRFHRRL